MVAVEKFVVFFWAVNEEEEREKEEYVGML